MIKHVIIWTFKSEISDDEKAISAQNIKMGLEALKGVVDGLVDIKVNTCFLESSNGDLMLDSTLENEQALQNYQTHPEHLKVAQLVKSVTSGRKCVDYIV